MFTLQDVTRLVQEQLELRLGEGENTTSPAHTATTTTRTYTPDDLVGVVGDGGEMVTTPVAAAVRKASALAEVARVRAKKKASAASNPNTAAPSVAGPVAMSKRTPVVVGPAAMSKRTPPTKNANDNAPHPTTPTTTATPDALVAARTEEEGTNFIAARTEEEETESIASGPSVPDPENGLPSQRHQLDKDPSVPDPENADADVAMVTAAIWRAYPVHHRTVRCSCFRLFCCFIGFIAIWINEVGPFFFRSISNQCIRCGSALLGCDLDHHTHPALV
jgi:hypothetical protein